MSVIFSLIVVVFVSCGYFAVRAIDVIITRSSPLVVIPVRHVVFG
jgi:hypothetical protein